MSNARCLTEGVDLPAVDMVGFLSPRRSLVDIVQATGRAMRRSAGKDYGYVLVPLYVEQMRGESVEDAVVRSKYDEVWRVLQSLKEHDDLLAQIISDMRIQRGQTGGYDDSRFRERVEVLGPTISLENLRRFISSACIDALGESWFERYGELVAYNQRFGHCDVPKRSVGKERKLANWVVQQRVSRNAGTLTREKIDLLDRLGFKWHPGGHRWREHYLALIAYKQRFGHCRVPQEWKENQKLATWVSTQRNRRRIGQLQADRIEALDRLGFGWAVDITTWEDRFKELCEYKQRFGHTRVHVRWPENPKLGAWVVEQRHNRRRRKIRPEYEHRLNEIGFEWDVSEKDPAAWDRMFDELRRFKNENGNLRVSADKNRKLAEWCQTQRRRFRLGRLPERRLRKLEETGFEWSTPNVSDRWNEMFHRLSEYRRLAGSCSFQQCDPSTRPLRNWCVRQRKLRRLGLLSEERVAALSALEFQWTPRQTPASSRDPNQSATPRVSWDRMFNELLEFFKIHGHYDVPQRWKANPQLAAWVIAQRAAYRRETLSAEQVQQLTSLGFRWEPFANKWDEMYRALSKFHERFGHTRVAQKWKENPRLAHWVAVQRRQKKLNRISEDRIAKLELLGFDWSPRATQPHSGRKASLALADRIAAAAKDWETMFEALEQYKRTHGDCLVPQRWKEDSRLADWVSNQRMAHTRGRLPPDYRERLESIGFDWDPVTNRWEEMFQQLVEFKKEHGHTNVPQHSGKYAQLAHWVRNQRAAKRYNRPIIAKRGKRLDEVGFAWRLIEPNSWESMFESLVEFKKVYGHCNVPQHWKENKRLGKWVNTQRTAYKRHKLSPEKQRQLNEIGFAWHLAPTNKRLAPSRLS
jgi:hypothetical protein